MKAIFFSTLIFFFTLSTFSQSKKDTEDWLLFNLNKYFDTQYDRAVADLYLKWHQSYSFHNYHYSFYKNVFIVENYEFKKDLVDYKQVSLIIDSVHIQKVIEVDTSSQYNAVFTITFNFKPPELDKKILETTVVQIDNSNGKRLDTAYHKQYYLLSPNAEIFQDQMLSKFKKAFEHLIELNGGKIIKNIF